MIRDALAYLIGLGETKVLNINDQKYATGELRLVKEPLCECLHLTTLTGLVDYIKSKSDTMLSQRLIVHVISPQKVVLCSELTNDRQREKLICCEALLPSIYFDRFLSTEQFNIMLQSSFVENKDRDILLKVCGNITESAVKQVGDDGITQAVTMKTGVATLQDVIVPNPVVLEPFRTFVELEQPESKFIFRMKEGPSCAIFEADGGAWKNIAMQNIKKYLVDKLKEIENVDIIS